MGEGDIKERAPLTASTFPPIAIPIPQLVATIKAHLAKADHSAEKSGQHFVSAGLHLAELKARYKAEVKASKSYTWPEYVEERFGLRRSRADELIRIGVSGTDDEVHASQKMRDAKRRVPKIAVANGDSSASSPPDDEIKAACAVNGEDIAIVAPTNSDETIRHRAFLHRASEAQRLARENGFETAAPGEVTDEIIKAAFLAGNAWADVMLALKQRKAAS
jgi:hypothetical protein